MNHLSESSAAAMSDWLAKAVQDVTETMFGQPALAEATPAHPAGTGETVVACIGVRGACQLEVALVFPESLARRFASISLETPIAEIEDKMIGDVAGECSNMVVGAVKSRISDMGVECTMTVPRIVRGAGNSPDLAGKIKAAFAVIRGSAGPRNEQTSVHSRLTFRFGSDLLHLEAHS
jgi:CheY-specific phosphatase CheX